MSDMDGIERLVADFGFVARYRPVDVIVAAERVMVDAFARVELALIDDGHEAEAHELYEQMLADVKAKLDITLATAMAKPDGPRS